MSNKRLKLSLHIFRRDLRLDDNTALIEALKNSQKVIPAFIVDPIQVGDNPYKSSHALQFMIQSLRDLASDLERRGARLYLFYGSSQQILEKIITNTKIEGVYFNKDYTPFSRNRDNNIERVCSEHNIECNSFDDSILVPLNKLVTAKGTPYTVYSYFAKRALKEIRPPKPKRNSFKNFYTEPISFEDSAVFNKVLVQESFNSGLAQKGGRKQAKIQLRELARLINYSNDRDYPAKSATSGLSAHNKFGTVSIREVYHEILKQFGIEHTLIREVYWREFFTHIAYHYPHVFGSAFHDKYNLVQWRENHEWFKAWKDGQTGFPIVDAGMRELNATGFMHNRVRMIVASFLTKDLHLSWQWGEKYFAQKLVDYDPAVNNGNWQWAASTGCDAQPYFRIFNPWLQQKKFDPECEYIKRWIKELRTYSAKQIHNLENGEKLDGYVSAIIDHRSEKAVAEDLYANALGIDD